MKVISLKFIVVMTNHRDRATRRTVITVLLNTYHLPHQDSESNRALLGIACTVMIFPTSVPQPLAQATGASSSYSNRPSRLFICVHRHGYACTHPVYISTFFATGKRLLFELYHYALLSPIHKSTQSDVSTCVKEHIFFRSQ